jgi:hypothetical protein
LGYSPFSNKNLKIKAANPVVLSFNNMYNSYRYIYSHTIEVLMEEYVLLSTEIPEELKQKIVEMAKENGISLDELVVQLLSAGLVQIPKSPVLKANESPN